MTRRAIRGGETPPKENRIGPRSELRMNLVDRSGRSVSEIGGTLTWTCHRHELIAMDRVENGVDLWFKSPGRGIITAKFEGIDGTVLRKRITFESVSGGGEEGHGWVEIKTKRRR